MDEAMERRFDAIQEDEVRAGYRIKAVPTTIRRSLRDEGVADFTHVRFSRLNPARRKSIAQIAQRQFQRDIMDPNVLSKKQVMDAVVKRGQWTEANDEQIKSLRESTSKTMGELFMDGSSENDWHLQMFQLAQQIKDVAGASVWPLEKQAEVVAVFDRWFNYSDEQQDEYTAKYAEIQGRPTYSLLRDQQWLVQEYADLGVADIIDWLDALDKLRDKLGAYVKLQVDKAKLVELQTQHAKIFADTVEQRQEAAEEMARIYFVTEKCNEKGDPIGKLSPTPEDFWSYPEDAIQWLSAEAYFFLIGLPDEAREYLRTFGFLKAEWDPTEEDTKRSESAASDASPVPQSSNSDTEAVVATAAVSSAPLRRTT